MRLQLQPRHRAPARACACVNVHPAHRSMPAQRLHVCARVPAPAHIHAVVRACACLRMCMRASMCGVHLDELCHTCYGFSYLSQPLLRVCLYTHLYTYPSMCAYTWPHTCLCTCLHACICTHAYAHVYIVHIEARDPVHTNDCTQVCTHARDLRFFCWPLCKHVPAPRVWLRSKHHNSAYGRRGLAHAGSMARYGTALRSAVR